ncbi:MAG: hypothetical protein R3A48_23645 [Polyangiales bacterium]
MATPAPAYNAKGLLPWIGAAALGGLFWQFTSSPPPAAPAALAAPGEATRAPGTLVVEVVDLPQPPYNENEDQCQVATSSWRFPGETSDDVRARLRSAGFDDATRDALMSSLRCDATGCGGDVPDVLLRRLPSDARGSLYRGMASTQGQMFASNPHRRPAELPRWSSLAQTPAVATLLNELSWSEGGTWYFADVATACRALPDRAQRVELLSILRRRTGLSLGVRVGASDDAEAVLRYWTLPGREPDDAARGLLGESRRTNAGVPLRSLLRGWPARRLDTFPGAEEPDRDCFWSTLHFHDADAERFPVPTPDAFWAELNAGWSEVPPASARYGDAVVFMGATEPMHAMIFLADDLVFTKNGRARSRPWLVSKIDLVRRDYPSLAAVRFFRRR